MGIGGFNEIGRASMLIDCTNLNSFSPSLSPTLEPTVIPTEMPATDPTSYLTVSPTASNAQPTVNDHIIETEQSIAPTLEPTVLPVIEEANKAISRNPLFSLVI